MPARGKVARGEKKQRKKRDQAPKIEIKAKKGDEVEGVVKSVAKFGAFVEFEEGVEGLLHVSEMSNDSWNAEVRVNVGDKLTVRIKDISGNKISLTKKEEVDVSGSL